jgi:hypothetical protein
MNSSLYNGFKLTMQTEEFAQSSKYNKCWEYIVFNFIQPYVVFCVPSTKRWPDPFACEKMDNTPCLRWDSPREVPIPLFGGKKKHQR